MLGAAVAWGSAGVALASTSARQSVPPPITTPAPPGGFSAVVTTQTITPAGGTVGPLLVAGAEVTIHVPPGAFPADVQLTVTASCTINAATLDFGSTSLLATLIDATTTLSVTCTNTTPYSIGMDNGVNFSATRRMQQGASGNFIGYAIYTDSARTNPWTTASSSTRSGSKCSA